MDLILLPGMSSHNKAWIERIEELLRPLFPKAKIQYYRSWQTGDFDFDYEYKQLKKLTKGMKDYVLFAKSVGVILALKAINEKTIKPQKCIFVGSAIGWAKYLELPIRDWLTNNPVPTLFVQHTGDPAISAVELKNILASTEVKHYRFVEFPGSGHDYPETETLSELLIRFVK